jgi:DNA-binding HxlR family transcriptional regulator
VPLARTASTWSRASSRAARASSFSDLEAELDIAPNTLSTRLGELTEAGLLDREAYDEVPPRVEYTPTEKAESLFPAFARLHHWAIEHEF